MSPAQDVTGVDLSSAPVTSTSEPAAPVAGSGRVETAAVVEGKPDAAVFDPVLLLHLDPQGRTYDPLCNRPRAGDKDGWEPGSPLCWRNHPAAPPILAAYLCETRTVERLAAAEDAIGGMARALLAAYRDRERLTAEVERLRQRVAELAGVAS